MTTVDGTILWQRVLVIERQGRPQQPSVHIDATGHLWLYVPDGDHLAVLDAGRATRSPEPD